MTLNFTLTYEDFAEAHQVHRRPARRARLGLGERLLFLWILLAAIAVVICIGIVEGVARAARGAGPTIPMTATSWAIAIAVPWFIYLVVIGLLWFVATGVVGPNERPMFRQMMLVMVAVTLFNGVVTTIAQGGPDRAKPPPDPKQETSFILTLLPWVTICIVLWLYIFRYLRNTLWRHWEAQPNLRLPNTVTVNDEGLRITDANVAHDYRWSAFLKFREGDSMFLLYTSHVGFLMIPKRAMPEPGQVETFRQILEQRVAGDGPIPARFPMHQSVPV